MKLQIAGTVANSIVDGPGIRYAVFAQGCPHNCKGCHNPHTHDPCGGRTADTADIIAAVKNDPLLSGVTFSGGEPFLQPLPLAEIAAAVKPLNIMVYTGYTFEELMNFSGEKSRGARALLEQTDVLVDGRYIAGLFDITLRFRGSANQRVIDVRTSMGTGIACLTEF